MTATRNVDRFVAIVIIFLVPAILVAAWLRDYRPEGADHDEAGGAPMSGMPMPGGHRHGAAPAPLAPATGEPSTMPAEPAGHSHGAAPPEPAPSAESAQPAAEQPPPAHHHHHSH